MRLIGYLFKIGIAGIFSLIVLSAFTLVYNYSGVHISNPSGATDYMWESRQYKADMTEGFAWQRFDENGFNNTQEVSKKNIDILIMGRSHMEAVQVSQTQNTAYLLNELLPEYKVYNIGTSGHTIYTCIKNMQSAIAEYKPSSYVILETDRISLDMTEMEAVLNGTYEKIPSYESGMIFSLQKNVPAVKAIFKQCMDWISVQKRTSSDVAELGRELDERLEEQDYINLLDHFLEKGAEAVQGNCKLIIFYQPSTLINTEGVFVDSTEQQDLENFKTICKKHGIIFIDMTEEFKALYERKNILAHGFNNTAVGSGHLNRYGHKVIADCLANIIKGEHDVTQ